MIHELKILPSHFENAASGDKQFEIRDNTDRGFQKGDTIVLREHEPGWGYDKGYTDRSMRGEITYVTNYHQRKGFVVFAYKILDSTSNHFVDDNE